MGMYCCCGVKKIDNWRCECDWEDWFLCFQMDHNKDNFPKNIPIKKIPDKDGTYEVRTFADGDYDQSQSEFSLEPKNFGELTNILVSHWKIAYSDGWCGYRGVFAWKNQKYEHENNIHHLFECECEKCAEKWKRVSRLKPWMDLRREFNLRCSNLVIEPTENKNHAHKKANSYT